MVHFGSGRNKSFNKNSNNRGRNFNKGRNSGIRDFGPPESVIEVGSYLHPCEGDLVVKLTINKIPYNNAFVYLENKSTIGKIDEIFGPLNCPYFSVKLGDGFHAHSFEKSQRLFIDPSKLLPMERFMSGDTKKKAPTPHMKGNTDGKGYSHSNYGRGSNRGNRRSRGGGRFQNQRNQYGNKPSGKFGPTNKFKN